MSNKQTGSSVPETGFAKKLTLFDATMIAIAGMIGSGIFVNPYVVAQKTETPFLILLVWTAGGAFALAGAFVFAELSTVLPKVGGQYAFFREAIHPLMGFLHGWTLLLVIQSAATGAVAVTFADHFVKFFALPKDFAVPLGVIILFAIAIYHCLGVKTGAILINMITFAKTLALAILIIGAFVFTKESGINFTPLVPEAKTEWQLVSVFFSGLVPVMFAYGGWQSLNYVAEEVQDPIRNLPRAIIIAVVCVIVVYVGANIAYVHVLSAPDLAATKTPAVDLATKLGGGVCGNFMNILIIVSTFGFLNLSLLAAPRVYYAMAADGAFFGMFGRLSSRSQVPTAAILLQAAIAAFYATWRTYAELLGNAVLADWVFFTLAGVSVFLFPFQHSGIRSLEFT